MKNQVKISKNPNVNWENDEYQFARLIAEMEGCGGFCLPQKVMNELLENTDWEKEDLFEIVERAQAKWDDIKSRT